MIYDVRPISVLVAGLLANRKDVVLEYSSTW